MKLVENTKCDKADCDTKGQCTEISMKSGGAVYLCFACLHEGQAAHNVFNGKDALANIKAGH